MQQTKAQIIAAGRDLISQEDSGNSDFSDSELLGYANEGLQFLANLVEWPRTRGGQQVTAGTSEYTLPTGAIKIRTAYFGDVNTASDIMPLTVTTEESLKERNPSWLDATSAARDRPRYVFLKDRTTYVVFPTPSATESATGKKVYLNYVYYPTAMSSDSDIPDLPDAYHPLISEFIKHKCMVGKLKKMDEGMAQLKGIIEKSKLLQPVVTEEISNKRLEFGGDDYAALNYDSQEVLP